VLLVSGRQFPPFRKVRGKGGAPAFRLWLLEGEFSRGWEVVLFASYFAVVFCSASEALHA
jgi:hypothetical protein